MSRNAYSFRRPEASINARQLQRIINREHEAVVYRASKHFRCIEKWIVINMGSRPTLDNNGNPTLTYDYVTVKFRGCSGFYETTCSQLDANLKRNHYNDWFVFQRLEDARAWAGELASLHD